MSDQRVEILTVGDASAISAVLRDKKLSSKQFVLLASTDTRQIDKWRERLGQRIDYPAVPPNVSSDECEVSVTTTRFKVYVALVRPWLFRTGRASHPRTKLTKLTAPVVEVDFRLRTVSQKDGLAEFMRSKTDELLTSDRNEFYKRVLSAARKFGRSSLGRSLDFVLGDIPVGVSHV